jgi:nucleotide-binding universal stress UspA family protein
VATHQSRTGSEPPLAATAIAHVGAAVDAHSEGRDATVLASALARATGAEMMLLAIEPDLPLVIPGLQRKRVRQETEAMLRDISAELAPDARRKVETDLSIPRGLERLVRTEHRDLVVVGSSRQGHEGQVAIGHLTRQLLTDLHCALAVAVRGLIHETPFHLNRIGVGFDGGPESRAALATAAQLAAGAGAQLVVRGAVDDRVPALGWPNVWMGAIMDSWEEMMDEEEQALRDSIESALSELEVDATVELTRGRPAKSLVALSASVDLLVVGSRRWGPMARLLLGGTGEALVHNAHCSLLVVPRPATES